MSEKIQRYVAIYGRVWLGYKSWDGVDEPVCLSEDVDKLEAELLAMRCCGNCDHYESKYDCPCKWHACDNEDNFDLDPWDHCDDWKFRKKHITETESEAASE